MGANMSNADQGSAAPAAGGSGQGLKSVVLRAEGEYSFFKGLTLLSAFGTLIGAYFQNLSAYENKVAAQAQTDMTAATQALTETSTAMAAPFRLQWQLINDYHDAIAAGTDADPKAYNSADARATYALYTRAYADLSQNYNLLARKAELYIDMPSDLTRDPNPDGSPLSVEIDMSVLNAYGFDCEKHMPSFNHHVKGKDGKEEDESKIVLTEPKSGKTLPLDWYSSKHHLLAMETCFEITHEAMTPVLQWAAGSAVDPVKTATFQQKNYDTFHTRATNQVLRQNAFMSLAMFDIDKIRIKYRPNGFLCSTPGVSQLLSLFDKCAPVKTRGPLG
jgi:hypothetical protein